MFDRAIAECRTTLRTLHHEANCLAIKGLCQDDFEHYAQRLTETEQHLAYLLHLEGVERKAEAAEQLAFALADAMNEDETLAPEGDPEISAYKEPAQCGHCCHTLPGYADGTERWCSEECWELATAPGYYNGPTEAARSPQAVAEAVTGEGYRDTEAFAGFDLLTPF